MHLITPICKPRRSQHIKSIQKGFTVDTYCSLKEHYLAFTVRVTLVAVSQPTQTELSLCSMLDGMRAPSYTAMFDEGVAEDGGGVLCLERSLVHNEDVVESTTSRPLQTAGT